MARPAAEHLPIPPGDLVELQRVKRYEWLEILRRVKCKPSVKLVGFAAATYGNKDGDAIFPGIERLANVTNQDDRTVRLALAWLRRHGLMHRTFEGSKCGRAGGKADEHVLTTPDDITGLPLLPVDESDPDREKRRAAMREADVRRKQRSKNRGPELPEQGISDTGTGDLNDRSPVSEIPPPREVPLDVPLDENHPSARIERPHAAARGRVGIVQTYAEYEAAHRKIMIREGEELGEEDEAFVSSTIAHDYVVSIVGELDAMEGSTATGMIEKGTHPKAVVNTILKSRGESESSYRAASLRMLELPADVCQAYREAAEDHCDTHFPEASARYRMILADRLARTDRRP